MALNGVRQAPVETRTHGALVLAKLGDDGLLAFLDDEEACAHPDHKHNARNQADTDPGTLHVWLKAAPRPATIARPARSATLATKQTTQLAIQVAPEFIQIRRLLAVARALVAATGTILG